MQSKYIKRKRVVDVAASWSLNARANNHVAWLDMICISPMTFSQRLHQSHLLEIAEEFEQAIDANCLEEIKILLEKVLELN